MKNISEVSGWFDSNQLTSENGPKIKTKGKPLCEKHNTPVLQHIITSYSIKEKFVRTLIH